MWACSPDVFDCFAGTLAPQGCNAVSPGTNRHQNTLNSSKKQTWLLNQDFTLVNGALPVGCPAVFAYVIEMALEESHPWRKTPWVWKRMVENPRESREKSIFLSDPIKSRISINPISLENR